MVGGMHHKHHTPLFSDTEPVAHRASRPAANESVVDGEPNKLFTPNEAFKLSTLVQLLSVVGPADRAAVRRFPKR